MNLPISPTDLPLLRRARARGLRVLQQLDATTYLTTSSRPGVTHRVSVTGRGTCDCELNRLGGKRCPHLALTQVYVSWTRSQAVAS